MSGVGMNPEAEVRDADCLSRPSHVRELLAALGVHPAKALGQNFLTDRNVLDLMMRAAGVGRSDRVLEVGPGLGTLTERLLAAADTVTAVEMDARLFAHLRDRFAAEPRLRLLHADMLDLNADEMLSAADRVVANLPYAAGTRILMGLAVASRAPRSFTVTLQREVARRLAAGPRSREYGLISVWAQSRYAVKIVRSVPAGCFWPQPEVTSCIVDMRMRDDALRDAAAMRALCRWTRAAFRHRRKQLISALIRPPGAGGGRAAVLDALRAAGVDARARAEDLTTSQWTALARELEARDPGANVAEMQYGGE
jgi:16S rRNA (adenine1518-N6/adenine1519-N6)-dimethyltransferase